MPSKYLRAYVKTAIPTPVIIRQNSNDKPSKLKSKLTPKEGTQEVCFLIISPLAIEGIYELKKKNKTIGIIKRMGLHLAFNCLPKNIIEIENSSPDNMAISIQYYLEKW